MPKIGNVEFDLPVATNKDEGADKDTTKLGAADVEGGGDAQVLPELPPIQQPSVPPTTSQDHKSEEAAPVAEVPKQPKEWELLMQDEFYKSLTSAYVAGDTDQVEAIMADRINRIREVKKDYTTMGADELIRAKVQKEYPDLSGVALNKAVERYYTANFGEVPDEEEEADYQYYQATVKRHTQKLRDEFKAEQEKLGTKSLEQIKQEFEALSKERESAAVQAQKEWERQVTSVPKIAEVLKDGVIKIGKPEAPVNFKVDNTEKYKAAVVADQEFFNLFSTGDKENPIDLAKWARVVAYAMNPEGFEAALLAAGSSSAKENILDELTNPTKQQPAPAASPSTLFDAMMASIQNKKK